MTVLIIGGGIFGVTAALELRRRGRNVRLLDPGPLPHPLAASTDISKAVRMEYGADETYAALMERALAGWRQWNREAGEELFHETGVMFVRRSPMTPGSFEGDSFETLRRRGHPVERLDSPTIRSLFPAWNADHYNDGVFNPAGGYAESGRVVEWLLRLAAEQGVEVSPGVRFSHLLEEQGRVAGIVTDAGEEIRADRVIVAAGAWTPHLLPFLSGALRSVGMPVFHLRPEDPGPFQPAVFPMFGADIAETGYYGFPVNRDGVVKIANHGIGREMSPESPDRVVTTEEIEQFRLFLGQTFPGLAAAPIVYTRVCLYCDTRDGHFWIARDPDRPGLVVASGGSGHAFKFAPLLGEWIADASEGRENPPLDRFRWRPELAPGRSEEAARRKTNDSG